MKAVALLAALLVTTVSAQSANTTSIPYSNPETSYTTETDSNGVITGEPTPVTTQPIEDTTQPILASIYALSQGLNTVTVNNQTLTFDVSGSVTSAVLPPTTTAQPTSTGTATTAGSNTGASSTKSSSGAGGVVGMGAGALVGAGAVFAVFL